MSLQIEQEKVNPADYFGKWPYLSDEKRPCLVKQDQRRIFIMPPEFPEESILVSLAVSTDQIHCGFVSLAPGGTWHSVDEHGGDETYYILSGNITVLECATGQCVEAYPGDTLFLPMGSQHKGYNFSEEKLEMFWVIAPVVRLAERAVFPFEMIRMYKNGNCNRDLLTSEVAFRGRQTEFDVRLPTVDDLGKFPIPGDRARQKPVCHYVVNERNCLTTVFGLEHPMKMRFFVSNDLLHVGEFYLPAGGVGSRISESDEHGGDMVIYAVKGPIVVSLPDSRDAFQVREGEIMYLPADTRHRFINYNSTPVVGYFAIARSL